jgi:hypothetical protein
MPTSCKLSINGSVAINGFNIYDSCNGTEIDCFSTNELVEGLVEGNSYLLRVRRRQSQNIETFQEFYIYALEPLPNDTCSNSENIEVDTALQTISFNIIEAETNNEVGCEGESPEDYRDIWYNFTMPVNGSIEISSGTSINRFALYDSCNGTQISCFNDSDSLSSYIDNLTQNENYTLRVFRSNSNNPNAQSFTIRAIELSYPTCQNIQPLTVSTTAQTIDLDLSTASYFYEYGCDEVPDSYTNFWYEFTMPVDGNLYLDTTVYNYAAIYDSCSGTLLNCSTENYLIDDLIQGQTYTLRVFRSESALETFGEQFIIQAFERLPNDDCINATILPTLTPDNTMIQFYLAGATVNTDETCIGATDYIADAWWQLTMPVTGNLFIDTPAGNGIAVYDACNGNELFCNASEGSTESFKLIDMLTEGETYLIRFFNTEATLFDENIQTMNLRVYNRADNDECANAEVIPTITTIPQEITFDTFGSLINFEESCNGLPEENFVDVWFEFTMPDLPYLKFESYPLNFFTIYDACNGNEIECFAGNEVIQGLPPNETYLLRVFQRQSEMFHPFANFDIWASETLGLASENVVNSSMKLIGNNSLLIQNLNEPAQLELYNIMGQKLRSESLNPAASQYLELTEPTGIYFAKLITKNGSKTLKMVIRN